ncbi:hypothetical protein LBMAG53_00250 [Planctomycetota bacterium]|nr:hypothetical protein LBMAG53_00250 [Planctomycetota bacterium]
MLKEPAIRLHAAGVCKRYGSTQALDGVAVTIAAGMIHGLVGENGAGKSTLLRILAGLEPRDAGSVQAEGRAISTATAARSAGIALVHQHFSQVPAFTAVENAALVAGHGLGRIDRAGLAQRLDQVAHDLGFAVTLDQPVGALAVGDRQRLEIVQALVATGGRPQVLLLDEPTAVLAPSEVDALIGLLQRLAASGTAVVFTGHKLAEIARLCDAVTVLRRGRVVYAGAVPGPVRLTELMVGSGQQSADSPAHTRSDEPGSAATTSRAATSNRAATSSRAASTSRAAAPVLRLSGISVPAHDGRCGLDDVSLAVHAGEVVAIAGIDGNGQDALIEAVLGFLPGTAQARRAAQVRPPGGFAAIGVIPEDRHHDGLALDREVEWNLGLRHHRRPPLAWHSRFFPGTWLAPAAWLAHARRLIAGHAVRPPEPHLLAGSLSGGNQQKVVAARALAGDPALVVAVNPSRGLDVAAAAAVWDDLRAARDRGAAILLIHHDLDELLAIADRVLVIHRGRLGDSGWPNSDRGRIGAMLLGAPEGTPPGELASHGNASAGLPTSPPGELGLASPGASPPGELGLASPRLAPPRAVAAWVPALAVLAAVAVVTLAGLWLAGFPPWVVLPVGLAGVCGTWLRLAQTIQDAAPLLWCGLAAALCLRAGVLNVGLEGQYLAGMALAAACATTWLIALPGVLAIPAALAASAAAGCAWAALAGGLERWRAVPLVLGTLLLNVLAVHLLGFLVEGPLRDPATTAPQTAAVAEHLRLPVVVEGTRVHLLVLGAGLAAILAWLVFRRTAWGFELDAVGTAPGAARLAGIPVARRQDQALALGGALAGLAGGAQVLGVIHFLGADPIAYGYAGIAVALLGRLHPAGVVVAAVLVAALGACFRNLERRCDIPRDLGDAVQAALVLGVLVAAAVTLWKARR